MNKIITFLPAISSPTALDAIMARVGWYLYPYRSRIQSIRLPLSFNPPSVVAIPDGYDPLIKSRLAEMLPCCEPMVVAKKDRAKTEKDLAADSDIVLVWQWPDDQAICQQLKQALAGMPKDSRWYDVDSATSRAEGSYYLWMGPQCFPDEGAAVEKSRKVLERFAKTVRRKKAYVFGTGPSLAKLGSHDFSDGDSYVANSIVKNRELLRRIRPKALVAADPIFHTGCSAYAAEFRSQLIEVLDEFKPYFFVPVRDYYIYESMLPARLLDRLACIPFDDKAPYNINLQGAFYVNGTSNVLTLFLLPLAASFHQEIAILGCDGRPRTENQYFWSHDPASQFGDDYIASSMHGERWGLPSLSQHDRRMIEETLDAVGARDLARRALSDMSGGERQRLLLAQALMGQPKLLLLDEPLISLDARHQEVAIDVVKKVCRERKITVLFSAHELNQLLGTLDRVLYLGNGQAVLGPVDEVVTAPVLSRLYGTEIEVLRANGHIFVLSRGRDVERVDHMHDHGDGHGHHH